MNEEEKQAIKDTKDILKELNKNKDKDFIGRLYYKNKPIEDNLKILLNLIEKQQKEIEELKERNQTCIKESDLMNAVSLLMNRNDMSNYISKDKIREKIEEYKKKCNECNFQNTGVCKEFKAHYNCSIQSVLELLKELIGEINK